MGIANIKNKISKMPDTGRSKPEAGMKRIILTEDEEDIALITQTRLKLSGYEVILATNGEEALKKIRQSLSEKKEISLILLDLKMPKLDGYRLCKILKESEETSTIPILIFSASSAYSQRLEELCLASGADDYIRKPFDTKLLLSKISRLIEK